MCRIFGHLGGGPVDRDLLWAISDTMRHGGPDAQTVWHGEEWSLGSDRLAIQGIRDGSQPFRLGDTICVFNGEIYNHRALRAELAREGYGFDGDCDGNVLLPLYQRHGDEFVTRLEGMYAIAIIDLREPVLKLYTDPAGMKSLFYFVSADGRRLSFAQELPALSRFPGFRGQIDPLAVDQYLGGKAIWGPGTIYRHVYSTVPGSRVTFSAAGLNVLSAVPDETPAAAADLEEAAGQVEAMLRDELSRMLAADVPVCVITSGGLDSSFLTALARDQAGDIASFNIAYAGDWPSDERAYAAQVAAHCGTRHNQVVIHPGIFPALTERFVRHLDQPNNAPHSLSTFALFEAIHDAGFKVALTGDGADELFCGYARYVKASRDGSANWHRAYQDTMAAVATPLLGRLYTPAYRASLAAAGGYFADGSGDTLAGLTAAAKPAAKLETLLRYDQYERFPYYILRRVDHLSMAHAIEARIPFLQPSLVSFAHGLPSAVKVVGDQVKAPIAHAAARWLPASIVQRPKQPFTLPITAMMRPGEALYDQVGDVLLASERRCADLIAQAEIDNLFRVQTEQPAKHAAEALWSLLIIELWLADRGLRP